MTPCIVPSAPEENTRPSSATIRESARRRAAGPGSAPTFDREIRDAGPGAGNKAGPLPHNIPNAAPARARGTVVATPGKFGGITIATNMAGRAPTIKLGGNVDSRSWKPSPPTPEAITRAIPAGFDGTSLTTTRKVEGRRRPLRSGHERHRKSRRIDNQLRRSALGRQLGPGSVVFLPSCSKDDLSCAYFEGPEKLDKMRVTAGYEGRLRRSSTPGL